MNIKIVILFLAAAVPCAAFGQGADAYKCSYGDLQRRVEILTEPGVAVPCQVHYYKDSEAPGERQVLWNAATEAGYCERKAAEFIAKLEGWGWTCAAGDAAPAPEPAPEPDAEPEPVQLDEMETPSAVDEADPDE